MSIYRNFRQPSSIWHVHNSDSEDSYEDSDVSDEEPNHVATLKEIDIQGLTSEEIAAALHKNNEQQEKLQAERDKLQAEYDEIFLKLLSIIN